MRHKNLNIAYPLQLFVITFDSNDFIQDLKRYTCNNIEETSSQINYLLSNATDDEFSSCIIQVYANNTLYRFIEIDDNFNIIWEEYKEELLEI